MYTWQSKNIFLLTFIHQSTGHSIYLGDLNKIYFGNPSPSFPQCPPSGTPTLPTSPQHPVCPLLCLTEIIEGRQDNPGLDAAARATYSSQF